MKVTRVIPTTYIHINIYIYINIPSATTAATGALLALFSHIPPLSLSWKCMVVENLTNQREWPLKSLFPKERSRRISQFSWLAHRVARWPRLAGDLARWPSPAGFRSAGCFRRSPTAAKNPNSQRNSKSYQIDQ